MIIIILFCTVHELTPYDIKVVGALGDSVTVSMLSRDDGSRHVLIISTLFNMLTLYIIQAGFGADAKTIFGALIEYRGVSWR